MKKEEMIPLIDKGNKSYERQKVCYICKKEFSTDNLYRKIIVIILENIKELLNKRYDIKIKNNKRNSSSIS